ncbi:MAG: T9SS type A sorting domain-containing protein, partial [Prolixibacteraceae bacterium]|nr:T9SS type A sorting domain-containing protein [Prolixibacteraceae bacterium]
ITVFDGSIVLDEFDVPFQEIIIPHIEHELEVSFDNDFAVAGQNVRVNAICEYARPDVSGVNWEWCISQIAGNTDPCELNSSIHVSQNTENNETQVAVTFPSEGNYCITLKVSDFYQEKEFTHNVFVSENCIGISRKPDPVLVDGLAIPDDCPDGALFTLDIPSDFKVGNCDGYDCYIKKIYLPKGVRAPDTYHVQYTVGGLNPVSWHPRAESMEEYIGGIYESYIVYAQRYSKTNRDFVGDYIEYEIPAPSNVIAYCGRTDYCNTSTILDRIINYTQYQDLRVHYGHYIFEGEGGKIINRDLDLVARKSIKFTSGTQIKNSNFRASIITCDYSICNLFKSLFVEESDNMDGNEVFAENGLMLYPNPACEYITIQHEAEEQTMESNITIFDMAGRKVFSSSSYEDQFDIDVSGFKLGTYVVSVNQNGENYYEKFIKE